MKPGRIKYLNTYQSKTAKNRKAKNLLECPFKTTHGWGQNGLGVFGHPTNDLNSGVVLFLWWSQGRLLHYLHSHWLYPASSSHPVIILILIVPGNSLSQFHYLQDRDHSWSVQCWPGRSLWRRLPLLTFLIQDRSSRLSRPYSWTDPPDPDSLQDYTPYRRSHQQHWMYLGCRTYTKPHQLHCILQQHRWMSYL